MSHVSTFVNRIFLDFYFPHVFILFFTPFFHIDFIQLILWNFLFHSSLEKHFDVMFCCGRFTNVLFLSHFLPTPLNIASLSPYLSFRFTRKLILTLLKQGKRWTLKECKLWLRLFSSTLVIFNFNVNWIKKLMKCSSASTFAPLLSILALSVMEFY